VQPCDLFDHPLTILKQVDLDPSPILGGTATLDKLQLLAARNQRYDSVLLRLQALGKLAYGCPLTTGITLDMQHHQILQGRNAMLASYIFAEANEFAYLVAKLRERFKVMLVQRQVVICWHGISIDNIAAYFRSFAALGHAKGDVPVHLVVLSLGDSLRVHHYARAGVSTTKEWLWSLLGTLSYVHR
jgi:hypothetical protein